jgi:hypothetical protein
MTDTGTVATCFPTGRRLHLDEHLGLAPAVFAAGAV